MQDGGKKKLCGPKSLTVVGTGEARA